MLKLKHVKNKYKLNNFILLCHLIIIYYFGHLGATCMCTRAFMCSMIIFYFFYTVEKLQSN